MGCVLRVEGARRGLPWFFLRGLFHLGAESVHIYWGVDEGLLVVPIFVVFTDPSNVFDVPSLLGQDLVDVSAVLTQVFPARSQQFIDSFIRHLVPVPLFQHEAEVPTEQDLTVHLQPNPIWQVRVSELSRERIR